MKRSHLIFITSIDIGLLLLNKNLYKAWVIIIHRDVMQGSLITDIKNSIDKSTFVN